MKRVKQLIKNLIYLSKVDLLDKHTKEFVKNWKDSKR
jgi:hypothetical protein